MITLQCRTCGTTKAESEYAPGDLSRFRSTGQPIRCRSCYRQWRADRGQTKAPATKAKTSKITSAGTGSTSATDYIPPRDLVATWAAVQMIAKDGGLAPNMVFIGPSGCGKTEAARYLARLSGLPFFKVDAPSMTDPEVWFGIREVVVESGAPKTVYVESDFVRALRQPSVLLIDEFNRVSDAVRNILLPVFDDSRAVTNPLTGETIARDPFCFVVMTGNVGLAFTGTYAVDRALSTRALTTSFDYLAQGDETRVAVGRTGCSDETAALFVRFAQETRQRTRIDEDFPPISTREVLTACSLVARGLDPAIAARQVIINAASDEGGADSVRAALEMIWTGIRQPTS